MGARGTAIDLYTGCGGLSYGMEQGGFDVAVGTDLDPVHCRTHRFNFGYGASVAADITTLGGDALRAAMPAPGEVDALVMGRLPETLDLVCGGPPCVGFSHAGKRDPEDPRNRLVDEFIRVVGELQPRYAVMENVPGILTGRFAGMAEAIVDGFHRAGYAVVTPIRSLDARDFGVPQSRERVFVLAYRRGERAPRYPDATHSRTGDLMLPRTATVAEALQGLPLADDHPELLDRDWVRVDRWEPPGNRYATAMRGLSQDPDDLSHPRSWDPAVLTCSRLTAHADETVARYDRLRPGERDPSHRLTRIDAGRHCLTLRAGTPGDRGGHTAARPVHPSRPRVITVREGCRLHSLPDSFRIHGSTWHGFRMLGNSVPPLLARAVAHEVRKAAGLDPAQPTIALPPGDVSLVTPRRHEGNQAA